MTIAHTILAQLGGNRFLAMTGAKNLLRTETGLHMRLPGKAHFVKGGINAVRINLDPSDTYTMTFLKIGRAPKYDVTTVYEISHVYHDQLVDIFEEQTGLRTELFAVKKA